MFDSPEIFYFKNPSDFIFDHNWNLDHDKIAKLKDHKLVIADFSIENYGIHGLDHVYSALDQQEVNFLLLTHDPNDHQRFDRMLFYPYLYHWAKKHFVTHNSESLDKTYTWSCLNANPRPHRIYNFFYSYHKTYFKEACFTFHNGDSTHTTREDDVVLDDEVTKFWDGIRHDLKTRSSLRDDENKKLELSLDTNCIHPASSDSYVHLVTESTIISKIFMTEKTWKPIASGQLFLIFGNPGIVSHLRDQGVDVFDDIIDHGYDSTADWQLRLHQIHQQLEVLLAQDLKKLYINTHLRRQANIEKFFSGAFDQKYIQTIQQCINTLS
jgi:hypothetical protein